jgi:tryptophan-rich sensory protein
MTSVAATIVEKLSWIDAVVVYVWMVLVSLMIVAGILLFQTKGLGKEVLLVGFMIVATLSYPLYTFGYQLLPGLIGNLLYIALVVWIVWTLYPVSHVAASLLIPPILWVSVASVYVFAKIFA